MYKSVLLSFWTHTIDDQVLKLPVVSHVSLQNYENNLFHTPVRTPSIVRQYRWKQTVESGVTVVVETVCLRALDRLSFCAGA